MMFIKCNQTQRLKKQTCTQDGHKLKLTDYIEKVLGESRKQVRRFIRLTYLIPELLQIIDNSFIYDKNNIKSVLHC